MPKISVIKKAKASRLSAQLVSPFRTALGQHDILENVLFMIELNDGTKGFGEAGVAPHITGETFDQTLRSLSRAGEELVGQDASNFLRISSEFGEKLCANPCALAALETALLDALTRQWKIPLWKFFRRLVLSCGC